MSLKFMRRSLPTVCVYRGTSINFATGGRKNFPYSSQFCQNMRDGGGEGNEAGRVSIAGKNKYISNSESKTKTSNKSEKTRDKLIGDKLTMLD